MRQALKGASQAVRNELASRYLRYGNLTNAILSVVIPLLPPLHQDVIFLQEYVRNVIKRFLLSFAKTICFSSCNFKAVI